MAESTRSTRGRDSGVGVSYLNCRDNNFLLSRRRVVSGNDKSNKLPHGQHQERRDRGKKGPECFQYDRIVKLHERDSNCYDTAAVKDGATKATASDIFRRQTPKTAGHLLAD